MYPNTIDAEFVFVPDSPDWSLPLRLWQTWQTEIQASRNGTEQRNSRRSKPLWSVAFALTGYNALEWGSRRMAMRRELAAAMVVPLWPVPETFESVIGDTVTLDVVSLAQTPFEVGSYAFFEQSGLTSVFRKITGIGTDTITLSSGNAAYPNIAVPAYTAGALVYPCIIGQRNENTLDARKVHLNSAEEILYVEQLGVFPTAGS